MTEVERERVHQRFADLTAVKAWPEWPAALAKFRELGCTEAQAAEIRKGVEAVVLDGSYGTQDQDVAWHIGQALSLLMHNGYQIRTPLERVGGKVETHRSQFDRSQIVVSVREDTGFEQCPRCHGSGREILRDAPCEECHGAGWITNEHHERLMQAAAGADPAKNEEGPLNA